MKFKIGDRVRLRRDSKFFQKHNQISIGRIKGIDRGDSLPYYVKGDNGIENCYNDEDLEKIDDKMQKLKEKLLR